MAQAEDLANMLRASEFD
jgi:hypothetical protein